LLIGSSITDFSRMMPEYQERISAEWTHVFQWLSSHGFSVTGAIRDTIDPAAAVGLLSSILKGYGNVLTDSFLILLTVAFILMEAAGFTQKLLTLYADDSSQSDDTEKVFSQVFVEKLRDYMSMKTVISMVTGFIVGAALWIIGVDYPVLWRVLAFMLNFVPNIGSIIAAVPAVMLTIVQLGMASTLLVATGYLVVNTLVGNIWEPRIMGKGLGLSTLVVFLSLIFWGWVFGAIGMFLSVPFTMIAKIILENDEKTQWIAILLSSEDDLDVQVKNQSDLEAVRE
ncbi:MAG: AI-2E family transporter, partial [Methylococcales bacterium]|nr:AI-2E family transporter [Methylococcales bacterium]